MCRHKFKFKGLGFLGMLLRWECEYCHAKKHLGRKEFYSTMVRDWRRPE